MPFFSVIIPTYNRYDKTIRAIHSVISQTFNDFELIVIDDGSTDATPQIEEKFSDKINYFRQSNSGVSSARNLGIRVSDSEYITFLDSDDQWHRNKLKRHFNYISEFKKTGIHQTDEIWIRKGKRVNPKTRHAKKEGSIFIESLELCLISPSAVCINRSLFERYGLFDELLPVCEDYDLWLRITSREKAGLIREKLVTKYGGHRDQLSLKYWGMDRFRVYSILKLLRKDEGQIQKTYLDAAIESALNRCRILINGAKKRGNKSLASIFEKVMDQINMRDYMNIDIESLLRTDDF